MCEKNKDYRDFVLSRFRGEADLMDISDRNATGDKDWQHIVTLEIEPDARLTPQQQEVVANDFNMTDSKLYLSVRAKLAPYLLQLLNVNTGRLHDDPKAQQLILTNHRAVNDWLFIHWAYCEQFFARPRLCGIQLVSWSHHIIFSSGIGSRRLDSLSGF